MKNSQLKKSGFISFSVLGILFLFFCNSEKDLAEKGNIVWNMGYLCSHFPVYLLLGSILGCSVFFLLTFLSRLDFSRLSSAIPRRSPGIPSKKLFLLIWICILLFWLPIYLAYYPGICAYDMPIQLGQILNSHYIDHHPIFHTLLIRLFLSLGKWFNNPNLGIGLFSLLQMLLLSAVISAGITSLSASGVSRFWIVLSLLWACFFPVHPYISISITKDVVFSIFFLAQALLLLYLSRCQRNSLRIDFWDLEYLAAAVGTVLFRVNGKYALLVLLAYLFIRMLLSPKMRPFWGRLLLTTLAAFLAGNFMLKGVFILTDAEQGDRREMLSLPIQQLARTYVYHGGAGIHPEDDNTMSERDKALINDFILNQAYLDYRPDIADPVKKQTNTYVIRYRSMEFIRTYMGLFLKYPGDYLNAALATNAGYLSPMDTSHAFINENGIETGLGYIQTRWVEESLKEVGVYKDSKWEWLHEKLESFADRNTYLNIPILRYMVAPGGYFWVLLVLIVWNLLQKRHEQLPLFALMIGYYLTLFLGPTVQLRYLYPIMLTLPFAALFTAPPHKP